MQTRINVLLVDDDDVAREAVIRSFARNDLPIDTVCAEDGAEALDILSGRHPARSIRKPLIVLLDLNMPRMNGFEFLENLRSNERLRDTVVFVLSTSDSDKDRSRAYHENIAGYLVKSAAGPQFRHLIKLMDAYHQSVCLPI